MTTVISVEQLSKTYQLGQIGTGTFANDLKLWWARARGKPNPFHKIGERDYGNRYGETIWALQDVNLSVQRGEVLGIIGRNGAGKSTLLKILSRVTAPTSGRIKVKGRVASLLEVGTGFHPELTGGENIFLNGAILGMSRPEIRRKFDEIVDFAEVEDFITTPVKRYSSGMYVRLAFAVAAHLDPEILVVDEVLAVGDIGFQRKCFGKMGDVAESGRTVLLVSHDLRAIAGLASRAALFDAGKLIALGPTSTVIPQYLNLNKETRTHFDNNGFTLSGIGLEGIRDGAQGSPACLITGDPVMLRFRLGFPRLCPETSVYVQLVDSLARVVYTSLSADHPALDWKNFDAGQYHFRLEAALHLAPGTYWINVGVLSIHQRRKPLVQFSRIFSFEVLEKAGNVFDGRFGPIYVSGLWDANPA
jgi:lipopolysaccharide transport system ATP-binding protein